MRDSHAITDSMHTIVFRVHITCSWPSDSRRHPARRKEATMLDLLFWRLRGGCINRRGLLVFPHRFSWNHRCCCWPYPSKSPYPLARVRTIHSVISLSPRRRNRTTCHVFHSSRPSLCCNKWIIPTSNGHGRYKRCVCAPSFLTAPPLLTDGFFPRPRSRPFSLSSRVRRSCRR